MEDRKNRIYRVIMLTFITAIITFMVTSIGMYNYFINTDNGKIESLVKYIEVSQDSSEIDKKFEVVRKYLDATYIGEIDTENMDEYAIKGYVAGLGDEYTEYLTKSEFEELMISVEGDYVGIGIYMYQDNSGNIIVLTPIENSPAEEAGLQTEDIILSINGETTLEMNIDEVAAKIKGEEGTTVDLEILRGNETFKKTITRKKVEIRDSKSEILEGNIGYIQLVTFDEKCTDNVKKYISEFQEKGIKKVILDLRDNTGGVVTEAISLSELFIEKDKVVMRTYNKTEDEQIVKSTNSNPLNLEIVILVNEYSASATEIFTAAMQDNNIATVVGTKTYGKGVMQEVIPLFEGALKVTTEEFKTPNGAKINKEGITPNIEIEDDEETKEDEQLNEAIEVLK